MKKSYGFLVLALLLGLPAVYAEDIAKDAVEAGIDASFSEVERQLIKKYFGNREVITEVQEPETAKTTKTGKDKKSGKGMPPGLAKQDKLPPGLERQLQKNGTLPPGLAKRGLPSDLEQQLPPAPAGYERQIVEDAAIVLVHQATGKIADVVKDVIIGD